MKSNSCTFCFYMLRTWGEKKKEVVGWGEEVLFEFFSWTKCFYTQFNSENKVSLNLFSFLDATMTTQDASQSLANSLTKMQAGFTESSPGNCFISAHLKL